MSTDKFIFTNTKDLADARKACAEMDKSRELPDNVVKYASTASKMAAPLLDVLTAGASRPVITLFNLEVEGYKIMRETGWHPLGERPRMCEILDAKPGMPKLINLGEVDTTKPITLNIPKERLPNPKPKISKHKKQNFKANPKSASVGSDNDACVAPKLSAQLMSIAEAKGISNEDLNAKLDQIIEWQNKSLEEQRALADRIEFQQNLQGMMVFASFLGQLGQVTHSKEVQTFAIIAQAGIQIAMAVSGLVAASGVLACMGPIGMIGSAVLLIASLFMKPGPDPTEIILKQISKLSEQISWVNDNMQSGFLRTEKNQREILLTCVNGFNLLSEQLHRRVTELDIKLQVALEDIKERLNFLIEYSQENAVQNFSQELVIICDQVDQYLDGIYPASLIPKVQENSSTLIRWATKKSSNSILTGQAIWEAKPSEKMIKEVFARLSDLKELNSFLGFIVGYAKTQHLATFEDKQAGVKKIPKLDPYSVVNPEVWVKSVQSYLALNAEFIAADIDPKNKAVDSMIESGEKGLTLLEHFRHDKTLWDTLLTQYQNCLRKVKTHAANYAAQYSADILGKLNLHRRQKKADGLNQPDIAALDFILSPNDFILQFQGMLINNLQSDPQTIAELEKVTQLEQDKLKKSPVCRALTAVARECLAAEFLRILEFMAQQTTVINDYKIKEVAYQYWELQFDLKTTIAGETDSRHFATTTLRGNCNNLDKSSDREAIAKFIRDYWNHPKAGETITSAEYTQNPDLRHLTEKINHYFTQHRSTIVFDLCHQENPQHLEVKAFKEALNELDTVVMFIRLLSYLISKDSKVEWIQKLLSSANVVENMVNFAMDNTLASGWLGTLDVQLTQKMDYNTIVALPDSPIESSTARLFRQGIAQLKLYKNYKHLYHIHFPILSSYISPHIYYQDCIESRDVLFQQYVIDQTVALWKRKFDQANQQLQDIETQPLNEKTQDKFYLSKSTAILEWALYLARHQLFTQFNAQLAISDLDNIPIGQMSKMYLQPYGWSSSIRVLMQYAAQFGQCSFPGLKVNNLGELQFAKDAASDVGYHNPANMAMFIEGARSYLDKVINYTPIDKLAISAGDTVDKQVSNLSNLQKIGEQLKSIFIEIATSRPLFSILFARYLEIINEPQNFIREKYNKDTVVGDNREDTYRLLETDAYQGARDKILDQLSTYAIWIQSYLMMAFAYDVKLTSDHQINFDGIDYTLYTNKAALLEFLKKANADANLSDALDDYVSQMRDFSTKVLARVDEANDLNAFYQYLVDLLENPKPILVIDEHVSPQPLNENKIILLSIFLKQANITGIVFKKVRIDDHAMVQLMNLLIQFPDINTLHFSQANLSSITLEILQYCLPKLPNLSVLDISGNKFDKRNINQLCDLMESITPITQLNLEGCHLDNLSLYRVINSLESFKNIVAVNLSNNNYHDDGELFESLSLLLKQCPDLQEICIAELNLTQESLDKLAGLKSCLLKTSDRFVVESLNVRPVNKKLALNRRLGHPILDEILLEIELNIRRLKEVRETIILSPRAPSSPSAFFHRNQRSSDDQGVNLQSEAVIY